MLDQPFIKAKPVMETLEDNGYECFFVGGAVRDCLISRHIGDIDIATNATPNDMQRIFPKTVPVGIEHGTVLVIHNGESFEVTTYRTEGEYKDYRHPSEVSFVKDVKLDLSRRDFTINAIAMDLEGNLLDPFDGKKDLNERVIRTVGNPHDRFTEDPLRMLRGVRFVSQLNFNLDEATLTAISEQHHLLNKISVERITDELVKLFKHANINSALKIIRQTGMDQSLPIFKDHHHIFSRLNKMVFNQPLNHAGVMFAIFHLIDPNISLHTWTKTYKVSNNIKRKAIHLIDSYKSYQDQGMSNVVLYNVGKQLPDLLQIIKLFNLKSYNIKELQSQYQSLPIKDRSELIVTGQNLLQWFPHEKRGQWIGKYLNRIEEAVIKGELQNSREEIESKVREWKRQEND